ncbi:hypothetical protein K493DRAFT_227920 [Basidiobolus meristosporus CBS 931.73]|uniref:Nucleoporin NSP1 n=1 Tax=Basidiobolus meristosporus CBS 931.73 TaxID=1314790 RepID=A0A1Y1Y0G4_9FUNG|nr:hypothetical protein K493DRAFT_227920 [Basidiobolus meristosporus CBS 931.73]|eukprot:ORX91459.1 hypothetical protein K493DRAFT_227920 [Basidiobolus meristosporus CBS 931.73]
MDEILNKWSSELTQYTKKFHEQAVEVAEWDRVLVENGEKISKLYTETVAAEATQANIDQNLEYIDSQQQELSSILDAYESQVRELLDGGLARGEGVQPADEEREKAYNLAEGLNKQLDDMSKNLATMIDEINQSAVLSGTKEAQDDEDPIAQIVQILNAHLTSLEWIDQNSSSLNAQLKDVSSTQSSLMQSRNM